jgi:hypothetical protein
MSMTTFRLGAVLMIALGVGLAAIGTAATPEVPAANPSDRAVSDAAGVISLLDDEALTAVLDENHQATLIVLLTHPPKAKAEVDFLVTAGVVRLAGQKAVVLPNAHASDLRLAMIASECPCRGRLVIRLEGSNEPVSIAAALEPPSVASATASAPVWWGATAGLVLVLIGIPVLWNVLGTGLDEVEWAPAESWVTNMAVVGGIVNAVLSTEVLPETLRGLTNRQLAVTAALLSACALLAPAAFAMASTMPRKNARGFLGLFLPVAGLTVCAGVGQLVLFRAVIAQMSDARLVTIGVEQLVAASVYVCAFGVLSYATGLLCQLRQSASARAAPPESLDPASSRLKLPLL